MARGQKKWQKHPAKDANAGWGRYDNQDPGRFGYIQYWRGTWSPRQKGQRESERYDQEQFGEPSASSGTASQAAAGQQAAVALNPGQKVMQEIQKALTQARKSDTRIRKLGEDKQKKTLQWESYSANMRAKFLRQKGLYEMDMQKMDQEAAAAAQQGKEAATRVTQLVTQGPAALVADDVDAVDFWGELLVGGDPVAQDGYLMQALREANMGRQERRLRPEMLAQLAAYMGGMPLTGAPTSTGEVTAPPSNAPVLPSDGAPPGLPAAVAPEGGGGPPLSGHFGQTKLSATYASLSPSIPSARAEPYPPTSPGPAYVVQDGLDQRRAGGAPHPGQRELHQPRVPTEVEPPRAPVKEATKLPPQKAHHGGALSRKLEEKRAQELGAATNPALHPFRMPAAPAPDGAASVFGSAFPAHFEETENLVGSHSLVDDDNDEDLTAAEE